MTRTRLATAVIVAAVMLLIRSGASGQTTGTIEGTVIDQGGSALPGVTVEAPSPRLQGSRTATTDNAGRFRFAMSPNSLNHESPDH